MASFKGGFSGPRPAAAPRSPSFVSGHNPTRTATAPLPVNARPAPATRVVTPNPKAPVGGSVR